MPRRRLPRHIQRALDDLEPQFRRAFEEAINSIRDQAELQAVIRAIEAGDTERAIRALGISAAVFAPLDDAMRAGQLRGGRDLFRALPRIEDPQTGGRAVLSFDGRADRAERWAREASSRLITGDLTEPQRALIRETIRQGLQDGRGPRDIGRTIAGRVNRATGRREGGILGMDAPRAERYRLIERAMQTPEGVRSLVIEHRDGTRSLRYRSINPATEQRILRAHARGEALSAADQQVSLRQLSNKFLKDRGDTIARTEALNSLRAGRHEGIEQLVETGAIRDDQVERVWSSAGDARTREDHASMDGQVVRGRNEPFEFPDGSRAMYPGDDSLGAPAEQLIQCRCTALTRIDFLSGVR